MYKTRIEIVDCRVSGKILRNRVSHHAPRDWATVLGSYDLSANELYYVIMRCELYTVKFNSHGAYPRVRTR